MSAPAESRVKKIKAAKDARSLIDGLGKTRDLDARATMLHDRVSEGIKTICAQSPGFNQQQTEVLTEIAVHLALLFDSDLKSPKGPWRRFVADWRQKSPIEKFTFAGVVIASVVGLGTIANSLLGQLNLDLWSYVDVADSTAQATPSGEGKISPEHVPPDPKDREASD